MLMRHGIRPPTKATVTPPGIAAEPWPLWDAPYGHLTAHGAEAIRLLGRFDRDSLAKRGLLPREGCPKAAAVVLWSDTDQRTIATGDALLGGMFPGCGLRNGHLARGAKDPLFNPYHIRTASPSTRPRPERPSWRTHRKPGAPAPAQQRRLRPAAASSRLLRACRLRGRGPGGGLPHGRPTG
jgi:hypothetical protein